MHSFTLEYNSTIAYIIMHTMSPIPIFSPYLSIIYNSFQIPCTTLQAIFSYTTSSHIKPHHHKHITASKSDNNHVSNLLHQLLELLHQLNLHLKPLPPQQHSHLHYHYHDGSHQHVHPLHPLHPNNDFLRHTSTPPAPITLEVACGDEAVLAQQASEGGAAYHRTVSGWGGG